MSSFLFKCDFFDTLTSLATLKSKHIAALFEAVAIKMKRTLGTLSQHVLSLSSTECSSFFFSDASDQKQSREKQESNLCILWSCFPTFHAALTVCHKWSHLLQSVTSNASVGVQMWSIRAARCRTERQRRRATAISTEHQRINWTILQFVSSLWHLVLFCARQQSHLVLGKVVQSALPLDDSFYARMSKDFTPKTQLTQRVSDEWNEEYYDVSHDENPFVLLGVQVLSPDVSQKFLVVIPSGVRV